MHSYVTEEILRLEPEEGLEKVGEAIRVCRSYKDIYHDHRSNLASYFKGEQPVVTWEFQSSLVFSRFDRYVGQLSIVEVRECAVC